MHETKYSGLLRDGIRHGEVPNGLAGRRAMNRDHREDRCSRDFAQPSGSRTGAARSPPYRWRLQVSDVRGLWTITGNRTAQPDHSRKTRLVDRSPNSRAIELLPEDDITSARIVSHVVQAFWPELLSCRRHFISRRDGNGFDSQVQPDLLEFVKNSKICWKKASTRAMRRRRAHLGENRKQKLGIIVVRVTGEST